MEKSVEEYLKRIIGDMKGDTKFQQSFFLEVKAVLNRFSDERQRKILKSFEDRVDEMRVFVDNQ